MLDNGTSRGAVYNLALVGNVDDTARWTTRGWAFERHNWHSAAAPMMPRATTHTVSMMYDPKLEPEALPSLVDESSMAGVWPLKFRGIQVVERYREGAEAAVDDDHEVGVVLGVPTDDGVADSTFATVNAVVAPIRTDDIVFDGRVDSVIGRLTMRFPVDVRFPAVRFAVQLTATDSQDGDAEGQR